MLRYFIGVTAAERFGPRFPIGTLSINVSACFMIGFILEYLNHHAGMNPIWRYAFAIGFIGGIFREYPTLRLWAAKRSSLFMDAFGIDMRAVREPPRLRQDAHSGQRNLLEM